MNKFKEGDKVQRVHHIAGIYPNGKYKVVSGKQSSVVEEKELIFAQEQVNSIQFPAKKTGLILFGLALSVMGTVGSIYFNEPSILMFFGFIVTTIAFVATY
jgi:hypothetical protein